MSSRCIFGYKIRIKIVLIKIISCTVDSVYITRVSINCNNYLLFFGTFILKTVCKSEQRAHPVHITEVVKCWRTRTLCVPYSGVCRVGIAYSVFVRSLLLTTFISPITDGIILCLKSTTKSWSYSISINKGVCFSAVVITVGNLALSSIEWKVTSSGPKIAAIFSKAQMLDCANFVEIWDECLEFWDL